MTDELLPPHINTSCLSSHLEPFSAVLTEELAPPAVHLMNGAGWKLVFILIFFFLQRLRHICIQTRADAAGLKQSDDSDAPCLSFHLCNPAVNLNVKCCVSAVSSNHMSRMCIHPQSAALCRCHCVPIHLPLSVSVITRLKKKIIPSLLSRAQALEQHKWKDLKAIC